MMMRVKLVIIRMSDGNTVSRLISSRIWSDSESGRPSPEIVFSARSMPPVGGAVCANAGTARKKIAHARMERTETIACRLRQRNPDIAGIAISTILVGQRESRRWRFGQQFDAAARYCDQQALVGELDHRQPSGRADR